MRTKARIALVLAFAVLAGAVAWLMFRTSADPIYQGRSLSAWGKAAARTNAVTLDSRFLAGVSQTGTNAIPVLLDMVRAHDTPFRTRLLVLAKKQSFIPVNPPKPYRMNDLGHLGFMTLGPSGSAAVPELARICDQQFSLTSQLAATFSLSAIGKEAKAAVPALARETESTNDAIRAAALAALVTIHDNPEVTVPIFVKELHRSSEATQIYALEGLRQFAKDAASAVPDLIDYIKKVPTNAPSANAVQARRGAVFALKAINPEAANKLAGELGETW